MPWNSIAAQNTQFPRKKAEIQTEPSLIQFEKVILEDLAFSFKALFSKSVDWMK